MMRRNITMLRSKNMFALRSLEIAPRFPYGIVKLQRTGP
jgi:hypothetical protein